MNSSCALGPFARLATWYHHLLKSILSFAPAAFFLVAVCGLPAAQPEAKRTFNIPATDASISLKQFVYQSGQEVIYPVDNVKGVRTNAAIGEFTPREALNIIIAGTVLTATQAEDGAIAVNRGRLPNAERAALTTEKSDRPADRSDTDKVIVLNPFEVKTGKDTSYGALNSNSMTRFNTELDKTPMSADIMTATFMKDVDVTTLDALLTEYGAGIGNSFGNPAGQAAVTQPGDRATTSGFTMRGVNAGPIRLNGFVTEASNFATSTNFEIERVELIHGAQGLLYGPAGAGGIIVATTDQARFEQNSGNVSERIDQFGSKRTVVKANSGNDWIAGTVDLINESAKYRRLFYGQNTNGIYGQVAVRLPLNTTLRVDYLHTNQNLQGQGGTPTVNFGGVANDPRNGKTLSYLLFTGQTGVNNPATGQPYSKFGAIDNGNVTWENLYSFPGITNWELSQANNLDAVVDTVWSKWFSTDIAFNYNRLNILTGPGASALAAPLMSGNPYNDWAIATTPGVSLQGNRRHKNFRASGLLTNDLFHGRVRSQTSFGYDFQRQGKGGANYGYYLSDANGNLILNGTNTNMGRTRIPAQWWTIGNGPIFQPSVFPGRQPSLFRSPLDGKYYVKMSANPNNPAWVTPSNPLGSAGLVPNPSGKGFLYPGVGGIEEADYQKEITSTGLYLANFSSWWNDLFTTLVGYRYTYTANHIPNPTPSAISPPMDTSKFGAPSYNVGVDGRVTKWLRWYATYSANHNVSNGETDFYGNPVDVSYGKGGEAGLKFTPLDSRISGSIDYYVDNEENFAVNSGGPNTFLPSINPVGLNGQYEGRYGAGTYAAENRRSEGLEMVLNASPTPSWRMHLSAVMQTGKVETDASYNILYNDQFYTDGHGNVTYANGAPFLVPVTPGSNLTSITTTVDPTAILASGPTEQLTTAMISDPSSPWYAWQGGSVTSSGQIGNNSSPYGASGTLSNVGRALKYFNLPGAGTALTGVTGLPISAMQYKWPDPNNTNGKVVVTRAGAPTVGYPVYGISFVNRYEISHGPLKGLGAVLAVNDQWRWRTYLFNNPKPGLQQELWGQRSLGVLINLNPFYEHKFGRFLWRTQLNITNLTNHYKLEFLPNNGAGYTNQNLIGVRWDNQPRTYSWTNSIEF